MKTEQQKTIELLETLKKRLIVCDCDVCKTDRDLFSEIEQKLIELEAIRQAATDFLQFAYTQNTQEKYNAYKELHNLVLRNLVENDKQENL